MWRHQISARNRRLAGVKLGCCLRRLLPWRPLWRRNQARLAQISVCRLAAHLVKCVSAAVMAYPSAESNNMKILINGYRRKYVGGGVIGGWRLRLARLRKSREMAIGVVWRQPGAIIERKHRRQYREIGCWRGWLFGNNGG